MSVLPIDLQVLFSKVPEHSENIARHTNAAQSGQMMSYEKNRVESNETNVKVKNMEQYSADFNKINPESGERKKGEKTGLKEKRKKSNQEKEPYKPAPKEEGKGNIIDI